MIDCSLTNHEDPISSVVECLKILDNIDRYKSQIDLKNQEKTIELDLSRITWIIPCSVLLLSHKILTLAENGYKTKVTAPSDKNVSNYLNTIGFPFGNRLPAKSYYPIVHFTKNTQSEVNKVIDAMSKNIPSNWHNAVNYLLGELATNIDEHSNFTNATIMAQNYVNKGYVDIGVFDDGLSIPGVFEQNHIPFDEDYEAIGKALDGVSTKNSKTRGFGLSTSRKMVCEGLQGDMYLISRSGAVTIQSMTGERKAYKFKDTRLIGTLAYLRINQPTKNFNFYSYVE